MKRRSALAALGGIALAGCGFELRRAPELRFSSLALAGFKPKSTLADELRRQIGTSTTTIVADSPAQAQVVLEALTDAREKSVVASTAFGQVRELQLRVRFEFQVTTPGGRLLVLEFSQVWKPLAPVYDFGFGGNQRR